MGLGTFSYEVARVVPFLLPVHPVVVLERGSHHRSRPVLIYELVFEGKACVPIDVRDQAAAPCGWGTKVIRALRSIQSVAIDIELVLYGFAAEDGVIVKHQAPATAPVLLVKLIRGSHSRKPAADDDKVVFFTRVLDTLHEIRWETIADQVSGISN